MKPIYRGRIAPSPTGYLHLGHARTFWTAQERAQEGGGTLVLRNEDLDAGRCRPEFVSAMFEDLRWFGFQWQEGPDCGGPFASYSQSERLPIYTGLLNKLMNQGCIYPCTCSRKDIQSAVSAPHLGEEEPVYPGFCRGKNITDAGGQKYCWRFRVQDGEAVSFVDGRLGPQQFIAGRDFGDFVVWRQDGVPAYQLAVMVDDAEMEITEVVRGEDLLLSTARQLLLYRAMGKTPPAFYHCPLMLDETGTRLAKRHDGLSLRSLRQRGVIPEVLRQKWGRA